MPIHSPKRGELLRKSTATSNTSPAITAFPQAILYFVDNALYISTRRFLHDADYQRISAGLLEQLLKEEEGLRTIKESLLRLEQGMFRRLWQMERHGAAT